MLLQLQPEPEAKDLLPPRPNVHHALMSTPGGLVLSLPSLVTARSIEPHLAGHIQVDAAESDHFPRAHPRDQLQLDHCPGLRPQVRQGLRHERQRYGLDRLSLPRFRAPPGQATDCHQSLIDRRWNQFVLDGPAEHAADPPNALVGHATRPVQLVTVLLAILLLGLRQPGS